MRNKPYVYIIFCVLAVTLAFAIYNSIAKSKNRTNELKVQSYLGALKENEIWKSPFKPFMTIPYSKCWETTSVDDYKFSPPEQELYVQTTDECKDMDADKWYIIYARVNRGIRKSPTELPPPPKGFPLLKEINLNKRITYFYGNNEGGWTVNFKCGGVYFDLDTFGFTYFIPTLHARRKDHEIPEVFKNFIASIKCDEEQSDWTSATLNVLNRLGL